MSTIDVRECPACREMDAACAETMGWRYDWESGVAYQPAGDGEIGRAWYPSLDIAQAWELVEAMVAEGSLPQVGYGGTKGWWCTALIGWPEAVNGWGNTAPLAICRAFLLVHGVTEVEVNDA